MEVSVYISAILPIQSGTGKNGEWKKYQFVGDTFDEYPKKIVFSLFNPKEGTIIPKVGDNLTISFDVESKPVVCKDGIERWFTDVKVWKVAPNADTAAVIGPSTQPQQQPVSAPQPQMQVNQPTFTPPQQPFYPINNPQPAPQPQADDDGLPF